MTLLEQQMLFAGHVAKLIAHAQELGYGVTLGDAFRSGDPLLHGIRLAIDLNLFRDIGGYWEYLSRTEHHRELGEWWEGQHPLCTWGGRFDDGNHYSMTRDGKK